MIFYPNKKVIPNNTVIPTNTVDTKVHYKNSPMQQISVQASLP